MALSHVNQYDVETLLQGNAMNTGVVDTRQYSVEYLVNAASLDPVAAVYQYDVETLEQAPALNTGIADTYQYVVEYLTAVAGDNTFNETGSGGALGGGSAIVYVTYQPKIISAGALGSNSAVCFVEYRPTITSAGVKGGGSAIVSSRYNQTASGGGLGGDTANGFIIYPAIVGSGGSSANGSAIYEKEDIITGSGGASCSKSALVSATYNIIGAGGSEVNGTAPVSGGSSIYNETGSGGALSGNTALVAVTHNIIGAGGSLCNGSAINSVSSPPTINPTTPVQNPQIPTWNCKPLNRSVPAVYVGAGSDLTAKKFNNYKGSIALLPAITICNQKLIQLLQNFGNENGPELPGPS